MKIVFFVGYISRGNRRKPEAATVAGPDFTFAITGHEMAADRWGIRLCARTEIHQFFIAIPLDGSRSDGD